MNASTRVETRPELTIRRIFAAPRSLVFQAWTDGERLQQWCCPTGFTIPFSEGDIRPGGTFRTCMRSPQGEDHWLSGAYREIVEDKKIVFTHRWHDEAGEPGHETVVTVTLADAEDGGTRLTLHQAFFVSEASRDGHFGGWTETLGSLERFLAQ